MRLSAVASVTERGKKLVMATSSFHDRDTASRWQMADGCILFLPRHEALLHLLGLDIWLDFAARAPVVLYQSLLL